MQKGTFTLAGASGTASEGLSFHQELRYPVRSVTSPFGGTLTNTTDSIPTFIPQRLRQTSAHLSNLRTPPRSLYQVKCVFWKRVNKCTICATLRPSEKKSGATSTSASAALHAPCLRTFWRTAYKAALIARTPGHIYRSRGGMHKGAGEDQRPCCKSKQSATPADW